MSRIGDTIGRRAATQTDGRTVEHTQSNRIAAAAAAGELCELARNWKITYIINLLQFTAAAAAGLASGSRRQASGWSICQTDRIDPNTISGDRAPPAV